MELVAATALWMAVLLAAWTVVTGFAGATHDARLAASGARGLHAVAMLALLGLALHLVAEARALVEAPLHVAATFAARSLWVDVGARLLTWAAVLGAVAALVPRVARGAGQTQRVEAQRLAGVAALLVTVLAASGGALAGEVGETSEEIGTGPVGVQAWPGMIARLLYLVGVAAMLVPLAMRRVPRGREIARRWALAALGLTLGGLTLAAAVRYAAAAPPAALDAQGVPTGRSWSSTGALWGVAPLLIAATAFALARPAATWMAALLAGLAVILMLAAVAPAVHDWTQAAPMELGFALHPPLVVLLALPTLALILVLLVRRGSPARPRGTTALAGATGALVTAGLAALAGARGAATLACIALAGAAAALVWTRAGRGLHGRLLAVAQSAALLLLAALLAAISSRPRTLELTPGAPAGVEARGQSWRLTSQGASQVELPLYDGAVVAFEVEAPGARALVTAGERIYRDAHGHAGTRVADPGVLRGLLTDLRVVVLGSRGDAALVQVQHHPLATPAWMLAALVAASLLAAAVIGEREDPTP